MDKDFEYQVVRPQGAAFRVAVGLMLALGGVVGCDSDSKTDGELDAGDAGDETDSGDPAEDAGVDSGEPEEDAAVENELTLTQKYSGVVTGIENLRGLTFAKNGKLYASGQVTVDGDQQVAVARFTENGALDDSFGANGVSVYNIIATGDDTSASNKGAEDSHGVVELESGDLVVQANYSDGKGGKNVGLLKFKSDGTRDTTFGLVRVDFGWTEQNTTDHWESATPPKDNSWGIALDKSTAIEKIVVFGEGPAPHGALKADLQRADIDRYIVRVLASDGSLDPSFSDDGVYSVDVDHANLNDSARRGHVESDGAIVSAGYTGFGTPGVNHVTLIRLLPNGTPDTEFGFGAPNTPEVTKFNPFGGEGKPVDAMSESYAAVRQSTGRYVTTGYGKTHFEAPTNENDLVSFGVKPGALDTTYANDGSLAVLSENDPNPEKGTRATRDNGRDLILLPGDRTLQAGCYDGLAALLLVTSDGALDPSFGSNGILQFAYDAPFFKVALSPDGKRVAASTESMPVGSAPFLTILDVSSK